MKTKARKIYEPLAREYVVSVFPVFMVIPAAKKGWQDVLGKGLDNYFLKFEDHSIVYLIDKKDFQKTINILAQKIESSLKTDLSFIKSFISQHIKDVEKMNSFISQLSPKSVLTKLTDKELYSLLNEFIQLNIEVYSRGLLLANFDFGDKPLITTWLMKYLKKKDFQNANKYFPILTTPPKETIFAKSENELLKIAYRIKQTRKLTDFFKKKTTDQIINHLSLEEKNLYNIIKRHEDKFGWLAYLYEGPALDSQYYIGCIKEILKSKKDIKKTIAQSSKKKAQLQKNQKEILKRLKPKKFYRDLIKLSQEIGFLKVWRRERQTYAYYRLEDLLTEVARRCNLSLRQLRMLLPQEIEEALVEQKEIDVNKINQRMRLFIFGHHKGKFLTLERKKAQNFIQRMVKKEKINKNIKEIKGTTAYNGKVRSTVKIINIPEEISKINKGEILVSFATNPNLIPALKRASAIITDEGGLTSHAAIVSRELKTPCIVGTKIATNVLKDGDLVEVDAEKGIVKVLKR